MFFFIKSISVFFLLFFDKKCMLGFLRITGKLSNSRKKIIQNEIELYKILSYVSLTKAFNSPLKILNNSTYNRKTFFLKKIHEIFFEELEKIFKINYDKSHLHQN